MSPTKRCTSPSRARRGNRGYDSSRTIVVERVAAIPINTPVAKMGKDGNESRCQLALKSMVLFFAVTAAFAMVPQSPPVSPEEIVADGARFVETFDDRLVEYFTCGSSKSTAHVMWYQHGYGATGAQGVRPAICELAEKRDLKIVSPSFPGCGLSSHWPAFKARDELAFAYDTDLIMSKENIRGFYLTCAAGGSSIANSILMRHPEKVLGTAFLGPNTPLQVDITIGHANPVRLLARRLLAFDVLGHFLSSILSTVATPYQRYAYITGLKNGLDKADEAKGDALHAKEWMLKDGKRGTKRGSQCWGTWMRLVNKHVPSSSLKSTFDQNVKCVIASVEDDNTNPRSQQVWFQEQLPGCKRLHFPAEGWGHFSYAMAGTVERAWDVILRADEPSHTPSIVAAPSQGILKDTAKKQRNPRKNRTNV